MALAIFGITNSGLNLVATLFLLMLVVLWLALIVYTYLDARRRIADPFLVACATVASFFPFIGTAVYAIVRPPEYLEDAHERELEIKAAELRVRQLREHLPQLRVPGREKLPALPQLPAPAEGPLPDLRQAGRPALGPLPLLRDRARAALAPAAPQNERRPEAARAKRRRAARNAHAASASPARETGRARRRESSRPTRAADRRGAAAQNPNDSKGAPAVSRTLILVKPDAFERALTGEVIARFERKGLRIVALKSLQRRRGDRQRALRRAHREAVLRRARLLHHRRPAGGDRPRGRRSGQGRPAADRRDQPGRGGARLDPRRLRARGDLQHGPRLRLRRVGRARDRDLVPRARA